MSLSERINRWQNEVSQAESNYHFVPFATVQRGDGAVLEIKAFRHKETDEPWKCPEMKLTFFEKLSAWFHNNVSGVI